MTWLRTILLIALFYFAGTPGHLAAEVVQTLLEENATHFDWRAERDCRVVLRDQLLRVDALQGTPEIYRRVNFTGGEFRLLLELRTSTESNATLYWTSLGTPQRNEARKVAMRLDEDGYWHTYEFVFTVRDILTGMTIRFSTPDGSWDIRSTKLTRKSPPPLSIRDAVPVLHEGREMIRFTVANDVLVPMRYRVGNQTTEQTLPRGAMDNILVPIRPEGNLAEVVLRLRPQGFPDIVSPVFLYRPEGTTDWIQKPLDGNKMIEIAPDARMARLWQGGELFGIIAPIVHRDGVIPRFVLNNDSTETELHFESNDVDLKINIASPFLHFEITDTSAQDESAPLEGPVVRLFGEFRGGLLPGVEFLRVGDISSSEIDLERPFHDRSRPNPLWITMPLAVQETDKGGVALYWDDTSLQPTFSTPNRFDRTDDHRFSLIGSRIEASLELLPPTQPGELAASHRVLRSYIARKGFPPPPPAPRSAEEQRQLSLQALAGALQSEAGGQWGYAFEPNWERQPFADMFSTLARLTEAAGGRLRNPSVLVSGISDISNDAIFFISGRIPEWQRNREAAIREITTAVNADGSFLFRTRFPELETAASSYGYTALRALVIMEYVRATGNNELFAVVTRALAYLEQCDIPSGGFYRDAPFHTPDLQAAAALVWLYVWAYEYTGNAHYLERAKHFAYAGLPFVYQTEHMLYGTVGKFGGTHRRPPLHFGLLTTRVGIQYGYALNLLSKHDKQTDWHTVALGILHAVENLQYTDGSEAGCIPELFDVVHQERQDWRVNPCAMVSLRWAVEGKVDSLFVLTDGRDRYVAPYPLRKTPGGIEAYNVPSGQRFHILHNANRYGTGEGSGLVTVD
ncbi:MAG: hypothetical protein FWE95_08815 [Planctomycetaceae bacterium]|nr:hypothetical protein [Planctomycetaceae bacterium]